LDFKPQSFFIGVTDFFSVLLLCVLFTWFVKTVFKTPTYLQQFLQNPQHETTRWIAFVVVAYIFGNMLFVVASVMLHKIYEPYLRNIIKSKGSINLEAKTVSTIRNIFIN